MFCLYNSIFSILGLAQRGLGVILAPQSVWAFIDPPVWPTAPLWSLATNPGFSWSSAGGPADAPGSGPVLGVCGGVLRSEGMKTARKGNLSWLEGAFPYIKGIMEINMLPLPLERWRGADG